MKKDKLSVEELRSIIMPIAERHGVDSILLFGSAARGDDDDDSDHDFCVDTGRIEDYDGLAHLVRDMEDLIRSKVDVITLGGIRPDSGLMRNLRRDGIVVYSRTA
ncbi:MAG: nucleotidyltransferase domain-containing protein [Methanomassiliicoccaceae archaeon]|nr:nucleotidyltransferase domain-containing protein [Methanomassiliicoccaceae archaeon]